jgi:hypothetical protein
MALTTPGEHTANDQRRGSTAAVWLVVALVLSPVLYVLSLGPAVRLLGDAPVSGFTAAFYFPLERLAHNCQPIGDALRWYVSLWLP